MSALGRLEERWAIYYHQFLLHQCLHRDCVWMDGMWYFPEIGRRADTLHMFSPSRWGTVNDFKFYDFHLPNGSTIEHMAWRYIGNGDPSKAWLQDYVAYDLNMVTVDMQVITPDEVSN